MNGAIRPIRKVLPLNGSLAGIVPIVLALSSPARAAQPAEPPQVVSTIRAPSLPWQPEMDAVGNLQAEQGVNLAFEIPGIVAKIDFKSGQTVAAGNVLAQLRLNDESGILAQLKAQAEFAAISLGRSSRLLQTTTTSKSVVDQDRANLASLAGQLDAEEARIREKTLTAPFAGQLGIRQVNLGQFLPAGTTVVTLQSLDPIDADFYVSQQQLKDLHVGTPIGVRVDAWKNRIFTGTVQAITPQVDQTSRTVLVRAQLGNKDHALLPGMFVAVQAESGPATVHVTLPLSAITATTYGTTVYVLRDAPGGGRIAHQVLVHTGPERGDQISILSGLAAGEEVVTAGQIKLHEGSPVTVNNEVQPGFDPHPYLPQE